MGTKDKRIDTYISRSEDFAKPILTHIRQLVHKGCPEVEETIKWGFPHFDYKGMMCAVASFKHHCSFGFWKAKLMDDYDKKFSIGNKTAMGHFGKISSLKDLPSDKTMIHYIKEAVRLNDADVRIVKKRPIEKQTLTIPADLKKALTGNKKAKTTFEEFSYSNKKDYVEWITEAKTEATRLKRLETTLEWLAEGKIRNWKYVR